MAKSISFNTWLKAQTKGPAAVVELASKWESRRGRLTRDSVVLRAVTEYGSTEAIAGKLYDRFEAERPLQAVK